MSAVCSFILCWIIVIAHLRGAIAQTSVPYNNDLLSYSGNWTPNIFKGSLCEPGYTFANVSGNSVGFTFKGTSVQVTLLKDHDGAPAEFHVDGNMVDQVSTFEANVEAFLTCDVVTASSGELPDGEHTVSLVNARPDNSVLSATYFVQFTFTPSVATTGPPTSPPPHSSPSPPQSGPSPQQSGPSPQQSGPSPQQSGPSLPQSSPSPEGSTLSSLPPSSSIRTSSLLSSLPPGEISVSPSSVLPSSTDSSLGGAADQGNTASLHGTSKSAKGAIVGGVVGAIVFIAILVSCIFCLKRRRGSNIEPFQSDNPTEKLPNLRRGFDTKNTRANLAMPWRITSYISSSSMRRESSNPAILNDADPSGGPIISPEKGNRLRRGSLDPSPVSPDSSRLLWDSITLSPGETTSPSRADENETTNLRNEVAALRAQMSRIAEQQALEREAPLDTPPIYQPTVTSAS